MRYAEALCEFARIFAAAILVTSLSTTIAAVETTRLNLTLSRFMTKLVELGETGNSQLAAQVLGNHSFLLTFDELATNLKSLTRDQKGEITATTDAAKLLKLSQQTLQEEVCLKPLLNQPTPAKDETALGKTLNLFHGYLTKHNFSNSFLTAYSEPFLTYSSLYYNDRAYRKIGKILEGIRVTCKAMDTEWQQIASQFMTRNGINVSHLVQPLCSGLTSNECVLRSKLLACLVLHIKLNELERSVCNYAKDPSRVVAVTGESSVRTASSIANLATSTESIQSTNADSKFSATRFKTSMTSDQLVFSQALPTTVATTITMADTSAGPTSTIGISEISTVPTETPTAAFETSTVTTKTPTAAAETETPVFTKELVESTVATEAPTIAANTPTTVALGTWAVASESSAVALETSTIPTETPTAVLRTMTIVVETETTTAGSETTTAGTEILTVALQTTAVAMKAKTQTIVTESSKATLETSSISTTKTSTVELETSTVAVETPTTIATATISTRMSKTSAERTTTETLKKSATTASAVDRASSATVGTSSTSAHTSATTDQRISSQTLPPMATTFITMGDSSADPTSTIDISETSTVTTETPTAVFETSTVVTEISTVAAKTEESTVALETATAVKETPMVATKTPTSALKKPTIEVETRTVFIDTEPPTVTLETLTVASESTALATESSAAALKPSTVAKETPTAVFKTMTIAAQTETATTALETTTAGTETPTVASRTTAVATKTKIQAVVTESSTGASETSRISMETPIVPLQTLQTLTIALATPRVILQTPITIVTTAIPSVPTRMSKTSAERRRTEAATAASTIAQASSATVRAHSNRLQTSISSSMLNKTEPTSLGPSAASTPKRTEAKSARATTVHVSYTPHSTDVVTPGSIETTVQATGRSTQMATTAYVTSATGSGAQTFTSTESSTTGDTQSTTTVEVEAKSSTEASTPAIIVSTTSSVTSFVVDRTTSLATSSGANKSGTGSPFESTEMETTASTRAYTTPIQRPIISSSAELTTPASHSSMTITATETTLYASAEAKQTDVSTVGSTSVGGTPIIVTETSLLTGETATIAMETTALDQGTPTNSTETPTISMETPTVDSETAALSMETVNVVTGAPTIYKETPTVTSETPPISTKAVTVAFKTPAVAEITLAVPSETWTAIRRTAPFKRTTTKTSAIINTIETRKEAESTETTVGQTSAATLRTKSTKPQTSIHPSLSTKAAKLTSSGSPGAWTAERTKDHKLATTKSATAEAKTVSAGAAATAGTILRVSPTVLANSTISDGISEAKRPTSTMPLTTATTPMSSDTATSASKTSSSADFTWFSRHNYTVCQSVACVNLSRIFRDQINASASPCNDFFEFACGKSVTRRPADKAPDPDASVGIRKIAEDRIRNSIRLALLAVNYTEMTTPDVIRHAKKYFTLCSKYRRDNNQSARRLEVIRYVMRFAKWPFFAGGHMAKKVKLSQELDFSGLLGKLVGNLSIAPLMRLSVHPPFLGTTHRSSFLLEPVLIRRGIDYDQRIVWLKELLKSLPPPKQDSLEERLLNQAANAIWRFEKEELANFLTTNLTATEQTTVTSFDSFDAFVSAQRPRARNRTIWTRFFTYAFRRDPKLTGWLRLPPTVNHSILVVASPRYYEFLFELFDMYWKARPDYVLAHVLEELLTDFDANLLPSMTKGCDILVRNYFSDVVDRLYVVRSFAKKKHSMVKLIADRLKSAAKDILSSSTWMTVKSKATLLSKLDNIIANIGYPRQMFNDTYQNEQNWRRVIDNDYFNTSINFMKWDYDKINLPLAREDVPFLAAVNQDLTYSHEFHSVNVPAGFLEFPFFDESYPLAIQYGLFGVPLAHELYHAFDSPETSTNTAGKQIPTQKLFETDADTREHFGRLERLMQDANRSSFCYKPGRNPKTKHQNKTCVQWSHLTEIVPDITGLKAAWNAFQMEQRDAAVDLRLPGLEHYNENQLFFLAFATRFCEPYSTRKVADQLASSVNPPAEFRVNFAARHLPAFAETFECNAGDRLMMPSDEMSQIF